MIPLPAPPAHQFACPRIPLVNYAIRPADEQMLAVAGESHRPHFLMIARQHSQLSAVRDVVPDMNHRRRIGDGEQLPVRAERERKNLIRMGIQQEQRLAGINIP